MAGVRQFRGSRPMGVAVSGGTHVPDLQFAPGARLHCGGPPGRFRAGPSASGPTGGCWDSSSPSSSRTSASGGGANRWVAATDTCSHRAAAHTGGVAGEGP
ncbi:UNVERIFIED_CONTAM: hypothetical protein Slati_2222200 [Sesamum latifolium]|uniref:Uncharacterized protein n=1 Tax=Sesamum latifolium TaxID=2727402 RepID=A0AAW2WU54_9LAMI